MSSLLENLKAIRDGQRDESVGICGNLPDGQIVDFASLAEKWPKHSGSFDFPIPGDYKVYRYCVKCGTLWQGEQLQLRLELLDFVIGELEK